MKKSRLLIVAVVLIIALVAVVAVSCTATDTPAVTKDAIHVLNTGWEDAIILESNGHYGLVDTGEPGRGAYIVDYLQRLSGKKQIHLEFIIITHGHIDHMGGMEYIVKNDNVTVDKAIFKKQQLAIGESDVYNKGINACRAKNVPMITDASIDGMQLTLGDMEITLLNGAPLKGMYTTNEESICQLVKIGDVQALLAGDMVTAEHEKIVYEAVNSTVDFLKVGHHGMRDSTGTDIYAQTLSPKYAVYTNGNSWVENSNDVILGESKGKAGYDRLHALGTKQYVNTDNGGIKWTVENGVTKVEAIKEFTKKQNDENGIEQLIYEYRAEVELREI